jgi:uncharacterized SAM-binding protein YcdF (DUF218 family)
MKKILWLILPATFVLHSCSVDKLFSIGVRLPSPYSRYAKKKYNAVTVPFDVVVVPGFPYEPDDVPSILELRIRWARHLFNVGLTNNIIFSGSAVYTPYIEGIAMKIIADSLGLPSHRTFAETQAEHSIENVYYSMKMARRMGFKRIAVATDPFQARMLEPLMKKYCPEVEIVPIVYSSIRYDRDKIPSIVSTDAVANNFIALNERETTTQRYSGTRGRRVVQEIEADNSWKLTPEYGGRKIYAQFDRSGLVLSYQ